MSSRKKPINNPKKSAKKPLLSVVLNVKDMAADLPRALESVQFADEIIVVDMQSTDGSLEIARRYTQNVFSHPDIGYADPARNFALSKAGGEWILVLDADEAVPAVLRVKILELLQQPKADVYWLPRQNQVFGGWLQHAGWWPDYQPRLFRKGFVSWAVGVHRMPDCKGDQTYLPAQLEYALLHYNYTSIEQFLEKLNAYTSLQAEEAFQADPHQPLTASRPSRVLEHYFDELLKRWLALRGIDGGLRGTAAAFLQANYELVKQLKLWQIAGFPPALEETEATERAIRRFSTNLNYWLADWHVEHSSGWKKWYWQIRRKYKL